MGSSVGSLGSCGNHFLMTVSTIQNPTNLKTPVSASTTQVSNSSPWGPQCLLVFGTFSAPVVYLRHRSAKDSTHLVLEALIDSWLRGNHKNLQTLRPPGNPVWHPCSTTWPWSPVPHNFSSRCGYFLMWCRSFCSCPITPPHSTDITQPEESRIVHSLLICLIILKASIKSPLSHLLQRLNRFKYLKSLFIQYFFIFHARNQFSCPSLNLFQRLYTFIVLRPRDLHTALRAESDQGITEVPLPWTCIPESCSPFWPVTAPAQWALVNYYSQVFF